MATPEQAPVRKCCRCGDELLEGMQYCVACGTQNTAPEAAVMAAAELEADSDERKGMWQRLGYARWLRFFLRG
ncbi:hypothetical protein [Aeoliella sp.]|uniref:hypothetical protein n=1 Tax=Aeoliella sp. TaxID=2795800 RepID=UPI003CCC1299